MSKRALVASSLRALRDVPPVKLLRRLDHSRQFERGAPGFRGAYRSFAEALAAAPAARKVGYDHPELATFYRDRMEKAFPSDYPVLFWLQSLVGNAERVFDLGGHVGVTYYCYRRYLDLPPKLVWHVSDVPTIARTGEELAKEQGVTALRFCSAFEDGDGADILLALGSLQYIEKPSLGALLSSYRRKPPHVIVAKLPAHDGPTVYTVQSTHVAFHPYRIQNRREFIDEVTSAGYVLRDDWMGGEQSCHEPIEGISVPAYSGFYFQRAD